LSEKNTKKITKKKINKEAIISWINKNSIIAYIIIGIALFFLSMLLAAQMKTISNTEEVVQGKRESELADDLVALQNKYNELDKKYKESQEIVEEYKTSSGENDTLIASMKKDIEELSALSGTVDLVGEGVTVTLNDGVLTDGTLRTDALVHDSDVLTVVNELKAAGAEAISVNGQRIISTSAIRCVGPVIQVNYQKVAAPFTIKAIGNSQYLESAMNIKNGVADTLKDLGVQVEVVREKEIKIEKFNGSFSLKNATVYNENQK